MPRTLDHLVLGVRDLEAARHRFGAFGFTVTPPADHPFGTRNRLILLQDGFLELLTVGDASAIPPASPHAFSFGAHNQTFLEEGEGMSMLALTGSDARADARRFAERGLGASTPLDFARDATLPDGRAARVAFSLAFAVDANLPRFAFFTCQHHQPRDVLAQPAYQRHANGAARIVEVVLGVIDPLAHRPFLEALVEAEATTMPGVLSVGLPGSRITVLDRHRLADRLPECADDDALRVVAYRIAAADLGAVERHLRESGARHRAAPGRIVVAPSAAFGVAIEFVVVGATD